MAGLPYKRGLTPVNLGAAADYSAAIENYRTSAATGAIYSGDVVVLNANGYVEKASAAASVGSDDFLGVMVGAFWIDPTTRKPQESRYLPANTSSANGTYNGTRFDAGDANYRGAAVKVINDLNQNYAAKANTSVDIASLGDRAKMDFSTGTGGSTVTGQTSAAVQVSGTNAGSPMKVVGVLNAEDIPEVYTSAGGTNVNDWGAAETVLIVRLQDS